MVLVAVVGRERRAVADVAVKDVEAWLPFSQTVFFVRSVPRRPRATNVEPTLGQPRGNALEPTAANKGSRCAHMSLRLKREDVNSRPETPDFGAPRDAVLTLEILCNAPRPSGSFTGQPEEWHLRPADS